MVKKIIATVVILGILTAEITVLVRADGGLISKGVISSDNGTKEAIDDSVFDASDLESIETEIINGKTALANTLNTYQGNPIDSFPTFEDIVNKIDTVNVIPEDTYYYDVEKLYWDQNDYFWGGDESFLGECDYYVKKGDSYYPCDENGIQTSDEEFYGEIKIVETGEIDEINNVNSLYNATCFDDYAEYYILAPYKSATPENLSAGIAGYTDKKFILGSGKDSLIASDEKPSDEQPSMEYKRIELEYIRVESSEYLGNDYYLERRCYKTKEACNTSLILFPSAGEDPNLTSSTGEVTQIGYFDTSISNDALPDSGVWIYELKNAPAETEIYFTTILGFPEIIKLN